MRIPDEVRKAVAFIAYADMVSQSMRPVGSAFFIGPDPAPGSRSTSRVFAVTARHVIEGLQKKGCDDCFLRLNPKDPTGEIISVRVPLRDWIYHPTDATVDVAVYEQPLPSEFDQLVLPLSLGATTDQLEANEVSLGDEVFISGLFRHHHGTRRNVPIVRTGNLAALDEEPVQTEAGLIQAYLVEARSIGGLSGSPVFVNLGEVRSTKGEVRLLAGGTSILLLGLIHGHYNASASEALLAHDVDDVGINASINAGIAIVVPFARIIEVVESAMRPSFNQRNALLETVTLSMPAGLRAVGSTLSATILPRLAGGS